MQLELGAGRKFVEGVNIIPRYFINYWIIWPNAKAKVEDLEMNK